MNGIHIDRYGYSITNRTAKRKLFERNLQRDNVDTLDILSLFTYSYFKRLSYGGKFENEFSNFDWYAC